MSLVVPRNSTLPFVHFMRCPDAVLRCAPSCANWTVPPVIYFLLPAHSRLN